MKTTGKAPTPPAVGANLQTRVSPPDHGLQVLAALKALHLDPTALEAARWVESELVIEDPDSASERIALLSKTLAPEAFSLWKAIQRARQLGLGGALSTDTGASPATAKSAQRASLERLRQLFLALASDTRVVLILLASRVVSLQELAKSKGRVPEGFGQQTLDVLAPLAGRLGVWQFKWVLEDLGFRFAQPSAYKSIAAQLETKRDEREAVVNSAKQQLSELLAQHGLSAKVEGRAKHIYSIHNKMRLKNLALSQVMDLHALRVIVDSIAQCYQVLALVQSHWETLPSEFDDYIARPKPNGYQSLHLVARIGTASNAVQNAIEVQIRTVQMHEFAELGVAAHWRYKEQSNSSQRAKSSDTAAQQLGWMRQLLSWQQELGHAIVADTTTALLDEYIYTFTPDARVIELPAGSTPIDFAYHVHTSLGHRCRGAKVDGQMVPLQTPLRSGQTIEILTARANEAGGPSRDWLNPDLGFLHSNRARSKVRSWFNAQALEELRAQGRLVVEKALQREGKTALPLEELAQRLGCKDLSELFARVAREEIGSRQLEEAISPRQPVPAPAADSSLTQRSKANRNRSDVLVVGVDLLLTHLARCCRPVPPDLIVGYVTQGRGISIHRADCPSFAALSARQPERVLETAWDRRAAENPLSSRRGAAERGASESSVGSFYPVDILIRATDRQGLLRDITDILARQKINVTAVQSQSKGGAATIRMTLEVRHLTHLNQALSVLRNIPGVFEATRR